ncbi:MAG: carboxypeptidase regulatory-like domain-containing protein [Euryarchaeota archaeon]|nr:carboxypeptidase regulatory-like domain-containing protein [Euryarchaeota archaeon]
MRATPVFGALIMVAASLAGCVDPGAAPVSPASTDDQSKVTLDFDARLDESRPGAILGVVGDLTFAPLKGAKVSIDTMNVSRVTDESGRYEFIDLENGRYLVSASLEGYFTKTASAVVKNGTIYELNFKLEQIPTKNPYSVPAEAKGQISCHAIASHPFTGDGTEYSCGQLDPNNKDRFRWDLNEDAAGIVIEMRYTPQTSASSRLSLTASTEGFGDLDTDLGRTIGENGYARIDVGPSVLKRYYARGGTFTSFTKLAPSLGDDEQDTSGGLAVNQQFEIVVTVFYVLPGPANYSVYQK